MSSRRFLPEDNETGRLGDAEILGELGGNEKAGTAGEVPVLAVGWVGFCRGYLEFYSG